MGEIRQLESSGDPTLCSAREIPLAHPHPLPVLFLPRFLYSLLFGSDGGVGNWTRREEGYLHWQPNYLVAVRNYVMVPLNSPQ